MNTRVRPRSIVVADYGGVLGRHHQDPAESDLAAILGVSRSRCRELLSERSVQGEAFREGRISEDEFWECVFRLAGGDERARPPSARLSRLWAETYALDEEVLRLLLSLRPRCLLGVLTNIDSCRSAYLVEHVRLPERLDVYLPSYRFGAVKPKAQLWRSADATIRSAFGSDVEVVYIDDRAVHVQACSLVGWRGFQCGGLEEVRAALQASGLL